MSFFSTEPKLITLNLIYDYPVKWSKYKVLRDLVQNFYDSVGHHEWHERFVYHRDSDQVVFEARQVSFSYDWLIHIGASTKREKPGEYAGYFGEGFKIASLCALRDYGWRIEMASQDWELLVTTSQVQMDGRSLTSLAYRIWRKAESGQNTTLRIHPFSAQDHELLQSVLCSFFYRQNPLLGEEIWSSKHSAVFYRSRHPKPAYYPTTNNYDLTTMSDAAIQGEVVTRLFTLVLKHIFEQGLGGRLDEILARAAEVLNQPRGMQLDGFNPHLRMLAPRCLSSYSRKLSDPTGSSHRVIVSTQPTPIRTAVITDSHDNAWALDAVLADIAARVITQIINLGDTVYGSFGFYPLLCFAFLSGVTRPDLR